MHQKKASLVFRFVAVFFLLASVILSSSASSAQEYQGKPPLKIVHLGDSYSAGNGARNYFSIYGCYRSQTNWGKQFADSLKDVFAVEYLNRACSGSVIKDILEPRFMDAAAPVDPETHTCPQSFLDYPEEEFFDVHGNLPCGVYIKPQIDAINNSVDLVVMTIGGNDLGFGSIVQNCFSPLAGPGSCRNSVTKANDDMDRLQNNLIDLFGKIRARLKPGAKIAYVSYPQLSTDTDFKLIQVASNGMISTIVDSYEAAKEVRALGVKGEAYQKAAVEAANAAAGENYIVFYDGTKTLFAGHEPDPRLFGQNPERWIREFEGLTMMEWYHPNETGHARWGEALSPFETFGASSGAIQGKANLDVVFVVDTTGSMGGEIAQVKANLSSLVNQLAATTASYRVAVVSYRDFPERTGASYDYAYKVIQPFTEDPATIQAGINALTLGYGGDTPETVFSGIQAAIDLPWRPGVTKLAIVIGDAPALSPEPISNLTATQIVANSIAVDPVQVIGVDVGYLNSNGALGQITAGTGGSVIRGTANLPATILGILDRAAKQPLAWIGQAYAGKIGEPVQFDASGSYDPSGLAITKYEWDFNGDGAYDLQTTEPTAAHVYNEAFNNYVVVRVTSLGGTALASARTVVNEQGYAPQGGEKACELDARGYSIITDENGIFINCTPTNLPDDYLDGVSAVIGNPLDNALADLENAINGLSPVAFRNKYVVIKDAVESNNTASACGSLQGMTGLANAQAGKKITQEQATAVLEAVSKLETILGCPK